MKTWCWSLSVTEWGAWHFDDSVLIAFVLKICLLSPWRLQTWAWKQSLKAFILIACWQVIHMEIRQLNYTVRKYHSLSTGFTGLCLTNKKSTCLIRTDINVGGSMGCSKHWGRALQLVLNGCLFFLNSISAEGGRWKNVEKSNTLWCSLLCSELWATQRIEDVN